LGVNTDKLPAYKPLAHLNRACKRAKILNNILFEEVEELRERRNKIHLAGLTEVDDFYEKKDIQKAFDTAFKVLTLVQGRLENHDSNIRGQTQWNL